MPSPPRVIAVVLSYNGRDLTLQALASLRQMTYPALDFLVVDNGSTDGTAAAVAAAYPDVTVVRREINDGPSRGMNLGIQKAMAGDYGYLLLLNNDIEVEPTMLEEMVAVAEQDPTIGCVGPKTFYFGDRDRLWSAGGIVRFKHSVTRERGMGELDRGQYDRTEEVPYLNFCAVLMRREAVAVTGLWDPIYHLSVEDADWCLRMRQQRFRCYYAHRAVLYHMVSQTVGTYTPRKTFLTGRSMSIFLRRYGKPWDWLTFFGFLLVAMPAAFVRELLKGNHKAVLEKVRGVWVGMRTPLTEPPAVDDSKAV